MTSLTSFVVAASFILGQAELPNEHLKQLEPLIGTWKAEIPGFGELTQSFAWTLNKNFIDSSLKVSGAGNTYTRKGVIGWDASSKQIKQWAFSQSGSIRNFVWTKDDKTFTSKGTRTGSDGSKSDDEFKLTIVNDDTLVLDMSGQEVELKKQSPKP